MHFKIERSKDPQQPFYCTITGDNGKVLFTSETYHNLDDCFQAAEKVRRSAGGADIKIDIEEKKS